MQLGSGARSCTRALLALTTAPHPGGVPDAHPAAGTGKGAVGHRPTPGHLLGDCGKRLDTRRATSRRRCANCNRLSDSRDRLLRDVGTTTHGKAIRANMFNPHAWKPVLAAAGVIPMRKEGDRWKASRKDGFHVLRHT